MSRLSLTPYKRPLAKTQSKYKRATHSIKSERLTGTPLFKMRFSMWTENPYCANCGRLLDYPQGFHLDHITPLAAGGTNDRSNLQLLCTYTDELGKWQGCHAEKTAAEKAAGIV